MWTELSNNLDALTDPHLQVARCQLLGHLLYSQASALPVQALTGATALPPRGTTSVAWRGGKTYYVIDEDEVEFVLNDQFTSVLQHGGWLRYSEYGFRIRNGAIVEFHINCAPSGCLDLRTTQAVMQHFGLPEHIEDHWDTGELMSTTFSYTRGLRIQFDQWDQYVRSIYVGDALDAAHDGLFDAP